MDAGHYMSRGSSCQLRFDEANVHGQRKNCNRPGGTTRAAFRAGMIARVGLAEVERLERDDGVHKWTHDELRAIRDEYRAKVKELKAKAMTRKKCRRKVWNTNVNPIAHAIAGAAITDTASLDKLRMLDPPRLRLFAKGRATPDDWRAGRHAEHLRFMAGMGIGPEALASASRPKKHFGNAHARHRAGRALLFTGPELQAVRDSYEFHDLQRQSVSRSQYEQAIEKTANRIRSAHPTLKVYA